MASSSVTGTAVPPVPIDISDGELRSTEVAPGGFVPLPFESSGDFVLSIRLVGGHIIEIAGRGLQVHPLSDGEFVEKLPEGMRPHYR